MFFLSIGKSSKGFGNCKRLIGSSFRNIAQTGTLTTFDLHVNALAVGLDEDEIFQVAVVAEAGKAVFKSYDRLTMYNKFKDCVDESVDIKLCVCDQRIKRKTSEPSLLWNRKEINTFMRTPMFRSKNTIKTLHEDCLFEVNRCHGELTCAIEVANICKNQSLTVVVKGLAVSAFISSSLPIEILVQPNTMYFLYSFTKRTSSRGRMEASLEVKKNS